MNFLYLTDFIRNSFLFGSSPIWSYHIRYFHSHITTWTIPDHGHHINIKWTAVIDKPQTKYPLYLLSMDYLRLLNLDLNPLVHDTHTLSLNVHKQSRVKTRQLIICDLNQNKLIMNNTSYYWNKYSRLQITWSYRAYTQQSPTCTRANGAYHVIPDPLGDLQTL